MCVKVFRIEVLVFPCVGCRCCASTPHWQWHQARTKATKLVHLPNTLRSLVNGVRPMIHRRSRGDYAARLSPFKEHARAQEREEAMRRRSAHSELWLLAVDEEAELS